MPNWCYNQVTVRGPARSLRAFRRAVESAERPAFIVAEDLARDILADMSAHEQIALAPAAQRLRTRLLSAAKAPPDSLSLDRVVAHLSRPAPSSGNDAVICLNFHRILPVPAQILIDPDKFSDWASATWGVSDLLEDYDIEMRDLDPKRLDYSFATPWSPPDGIARALVARFSRLRVAMVYAERGDDLCGAIWSTGNGACAEHQESAGAFEARHGGGLDGGAMLEALYDELVAPSHGR